MTIQIGSAARITGLAILWGSSFLWIKLALEAFTPIQITVIRMGLGALILIAVLWALKLKFPKGMRTWTHLAVAAAFGNVIPYFLFAVGEQEVSSAIAGVINATAPIWTVLLTVAAYRSATAAKRNRTSIVLGFVGALLIFSPWNQGTELMTSGALACLGAAISYGVSYIYISHFLAKEKSGVIPMATGQMVCASAITLLLIPLLGWESITPTVTSFVALGILGVACTGLAYILNYRIITDDGATAAAIVVYLLPVVSILLGFVVLSETIPLQVIIGMIIVLVGVWKRQPMIEREENKKKPLEVAKVKEE